MHFRTSKRPARTQEPDHDYSWRESVRSNGWQDWLEESMSGLGVLRGLATGSDWDQVQSEVSEEMVGQLALVGMPEAGKVSLLERLREQSIQIEGRGRVTREGFFTLIDLPETEDGDGFEAEGVLHDLHGMDLIVYLVDGPAGLRPAERRWISLLRSQGLPLLPVLSKADLLDDAGGVADALRSPLALRPLPLSVKQDSEFGLPALVQRVLDVQPQLAIPLARETPLARPVVAGKLIRQSVLVSAMLGAEPIPLLDLPLQVTNHLRLALRMSAVYGQPGMDYRSRELLGTLGASLSTRYAMQQALRLVPVLGWLASSALGAASTWMLGKGLAAYFDAGLDAEGSRQLLARGNPLPRLAQRAHLPRLRAPIGEGQGRSLAAGLESVWERVRKAGSSAKRSRRDDAAVD